MSVTPIRVVAAVLEDAAGRILLAQRPEGAHQVGCGSSPAARSRRARRLARPCAELGEEIGIEVQAHRPLIRVRHAYADRTVVLDVHR